MLEVPEFKITIPPAGLKVPELSFQLPATKNWASACIANTPPFIVKLPSISRSIAVAMVNVPELIIKSFATAEAPIFGSFACVTIITVSVAIGILLVITAPKSEVVQLLASFQTVEILPFHVQFWPNKKPGDIIPNIKTKNKTLNFIGLNIRYI